MDVKKKLKMNTEELDEIVFQVLLGRMNKKKRYAKPITADDIKKLLSTVREVLKPEPFMLELQAGIVIVGDLHGNIDDLIRIFERLRYPPATRYLFLGDYVDRGIYGLEVMLLLFALKIKFPQHVFLIRGNHETESLTGVYGFEDEILDKYNEDIYHEFIETFHQLPLCATVGQRIFCVHGGISPDLKNISELRGIQKPQEIQLTGLFTDLVWSDPDIDACDFEPSRRGCGYLYGPEVLSDFLNENNLDLLVRAHEVCDEGVEWPYKEDDVYCDTCITIFSNTNYCDRENMGAVLCVTEDLAVTIESFDPMFLEDTKRNILLPYWLADLIQKKESERTRGERERAALSENKNTITNSSTGDAQKFVAPPIQPTITVSSEANSVQSDN